MRAPCPRRRVDRPASRARAWRRWLRAVAACAAAAATVVPAAASAAGCRVATMTLPVRMDGSRPIVTLGLNGTQVPMLLDTGAFFSMLPLSTATQLRLPLQDAPYDLRVNGHTGEVDVRKTVVKSVQLQGNELAGIEFLVGGNELGHGIMGIMGRNFLSLADTEFDLAHGVLRLAVPKGDCDLANLAYWAGDAPVNVVPLLGAYGRNDSSMRIDVRVNGHRVKALLDTGATTVLKRRAAHRAGIEDAQMTRVGRGGGVGEGHDDVWTAPVATLDIGGETITNSMLHVDDATDADDMLLGIDWFLSHRVYVSLGQGKIFATWNGGPVFAHGRDTRIDPQDEARYAAMPEAAAASDAQALARTGQAAASRGDFKSALADLDRACALAPADAACFAARAKVRLSMGQVQASLPDIEQALHLDPGDAQTRLMRAEVRLHGLGDRAGAIEDLHADDRSLPPESHLRAEMGHLYAELDLPAEALRQWDLWMPTHLQDTARGMVFNQRCRMRMRMNVDLDRALDDCRGAVSEDRRNASYRDSLGWVWMRRGQADKAIDEFTEAIALNPRSAWSLYGRGLARAAHGDPAGADEDLAAARKLDPGIDPEARRLGLPFDERVKPVAAAATASAPARP